MTPADLRLPFAEWREGQFELLTALVCADTPYLLLEAPTGLGKSGLALGLGRLLDGKAVILVGTKQLQFQYARSFGISSAIGRGNFACNIDRAKTADAAKCVYGVRCDRKGGDSCDYYRQKNAALAADETVLNYPYWLAMANYANAFTQPGLLVCDEAHLLEDELRRFASATLRKAAFSTLGISWPYATPVALWRKTAAWVLSKYRDDYRALTRNSEDALDAAEAKYAHALKGTYEGCKSLLLGDADNWVLEDTPWGAVFKPVWVAPFTDDLLLKHGQKIVFMSATILDKDLFCRQLGIPPEQTTFIRAGSTFPKENRPIKYQPVGKVKTSDPLVLRELVREIDRILDAHPGEHGLIHTVSYKLAQYIMEESRHAGRLVSHTAKDRATAIHSFGERLGGVLVSPSVTTGVDLPYEACSFQIIAKLAFPDLTDRQIKKRMKLGPDGQPNAKGQGWYNWATACALVQAYGRGMRAPDDNCVTYLLDGNYSWFRHAVKDMIPGWFDEAITRTYAPGQTQGIDDVLRQFQDKLAV